MYRLANLFSWKDRSFDLSDEGCWLDFIDDFGPALPRFLLYDSCAASIPEGDSALDELRRSLVKQPFSSLKPEVGSAWVLFAFKADLASLPTPFRHDGILLPFEWRADAERHSELLPDGLIQLAERVKGQFGTAAASYTLHPSRHFLDTVDFKIPGATFDSAWGALATGLHLLLSGRKRLAAWPFSTIAYDFKMGVPVAVGELASKFLLAACAGAEEIAVAPVQYREAKKILGEQQRASPDNKALKKLKIFYWNPTGNFRRSIVSLVKCNQCFRKELLLWTIGITTVTMLVLFACSMLVFKGRAERFASEAEKQAKIVEERTKVVKMLERWVARSADETERQHVLAKQTMELIADFVKKSDPLRAGQYGVSMIEILKAQTPAIAKLEPWELRADLGCHVGSILHNAGIYKEATNLLFSAVALNLARRPNSMEAAFSLYCASWCFKDMLDTKSAISYARKALGIYERAPKHDPLKIALACNALGVFYMDIEGGMVKARQYLNRAFMIRQKELGYDHVDVANSLCNLGHLYTKERTFGMAVTTYTRALDIYIRNGNSEHAGAARALRGIGLAHLGLGEYEKAIGAFNRALEIQIKVSGKYSIIVMSLYREIGFSFLKLGNKARALDSMEKALNVAQEVARKTSSPVIANAVKELERKVQLIETSCTDLCNKRPSGILAPTNTFAN